jgi:hypothetical protein
MKAHIPIEDLPKVEHPRGVKVARRLMYATISTISFWWNCPACRHINKDRVTFRMSLRVQCKASDCRRVFGVGLAFWRVEGGGPDRFIPDHAIDPDYRPVPVFEDEMVYGVRRRSGPINVLLESE